MRKLWIRSLGLVAALAMVGCGGPVEEAPVEEAPAADLASTEQELRACTWDGKCAVGEKCVSGTCYPCSQYPWYCDIGVE